MKTPPAAQEAEPASDLSVPARPPLKWAGGKRWQVPHLRPFWAANSSRRLVEPFCGGLAVALSLRPKRALLNDVNPHLINFYRHLRSGLSFSPRLLHFENDERVYYKNRIRFNELLHDHGASSVEAAALFYYLNRTGYNGLCRFNRSGGFNVPFGRYARIAYRGEFLEYQKIFAGWEFTNTHFDEVPLRADDFVYADPPYDVEFTSYSREGFGWQDQVRTAEWLSRHPGPVVLSNQATRRILDLYETLGYRLIRLDAPRRISCTGNRTPAPEVLAIRNLRA
jgi:DNA adenine methylase